MSDFLQWLSREGGYLLQWWLLMTLAGAAVLPLCWRWLNHLPDRGVLLARTLGLVLIGGLFWLAVSLGLLPNRSGSLFLCWLVILAASLLVFFQDDRSSASNWRGWWREHRVAILSGETLFLVLFVGWAFVRAHIQELASTEKPMDLMMLSAIRNSPTFPPNDAWLSGHSISYYYFGYMLSASLAKLSGVTNAIAFNLTAASWFGLSGITIFGCVTNLIRWRKQGGVGQVSAGKRKLSSLFAALLAVFFTLWLSNGHHPLIEIPYQQGVASPEYLRFWDAKDRCQGSGTYYWWWFGAARTIVDRAPGYAGDCDPTYHMEVIDEFPAFSFLLGDNHPHVYGIPFAALLIALAWHRYTSNAPPRRRDLLLYGACLAAQLCTNAWDAPIYFALLVMAEYLRGWRAEPAPRRKLLPGLSFWSFAIQVAILMLLFASPWLLTIRTQANGIAANLENPTRIQQLFVMFAPFLILLVTFGNRIDGPLLRNRTYGRRALMMTIGSILALTVISILIALFFGRGDLSQIISSFFTRRIQPLYLLSSVLIACIIFLFLTQLLRRLGQQRANDFGILLAIFGLFLVLLPEFLYLHDHFGTRMNTVFKFYYQAWLFFAITAAYGCHRVISAPGKGRWVTSSALILVIALGSLYLPAGIRTRIRESFSGEITLDSSQTTMSVADQTLSECLLDQLAGRTVVLAEAQPAPGERRSYSVNYGRIATVSGLPTVIAWEPHQNQWRGNSYTATVGTRPTDIDTLYRTDDPGRMQEIIWRYGIQYIIWGTEELRIYGPAAEEKFANHLAEFCAQELPAGRALAYSTDYRREN